MAKVKLYLDTRNNRAKGDVPSAIKIAVHHLTKTAYIPTSYKVKPSHWDKKNCRVIKHLNAALINRNLFLEFNAISNALDRLNLRVNLHKYTASEIVEMLCDGAHGDDHNDSKSGYFADWYEKFLISKRGRTYDLYRATLDRVGEYVGKKRLPALLFEHITRDWLTGFDVFLSKTSPSANSRAIHMRNIRAVFNYAIDNDATTHYPFRRYKIATQATPKRNISIDTLRKIFAYVPEEKHEQRYIDTFKLLFLLVGINIGDLCQLKEINEDRVVYIRNKTKKIYSIKVEPEALEIIKRYEGKGQLLNYLDTCKHYRSYYNRLSLALSKMAPRFGLRNLTTYNARHSWATIAAKLDIPRDVIALALGHGSSTVTDIYIEYDMKKVDEANRKVIDYLFNR